MVFSNFAKKTLARPISTAKEQGPKRSPVVFETESPVSAKYDAHCDIAISAAPLQVISTIITIKVLLEKRVFTEVLVSFSSVSAKGALI